MLSRCLAANHVCVLSRDGADFGLFGACVHYIAKDESLSTIPIIPFSILLAAIPSVPKNFQSASPSPDRRQIPAIIGWHKEDTCAGRLVRKLTIPTFVHDDGRIGNGSGSRRRGSAAEASGRDPDAPALGGFPSRHWPLSGRKEALSAESQACAPILTRCAIGGFHGRARFPCLNEDSAFEDGEAAAKWCEKGEAPPPAATGSTNSWRRANMVGAALSQAGAPTATLRTAKGFHGRALFSHMPERSAFAGGAGAANRCKKA